jgi:ribosome-interacting GTPase 1
MAPTISLSPLRSDIRQSTLLSKVTHTASETAAYEFTTLTVSLLE